MAEKSITIYTPCCGQKFTMYYQEQEHSTENVDFTESRKLPKQAKAKKKKKALSLKEVKQLHTELKIGNGKISHPPKEDSMMGQIQRYLASKADSYHPMKEIYQSIDGLSQKSASSMVVQLMQRNLIQRRKDARGKWEYRTKI